MAPLPPSNTPRFRVHYTAMTHQHTFQLRSHASPSFIGTFVNDLLTAFDLSIAPLTIDAVEFAADGSDIFNLVTTGIEGNSYGNAFFSDEMAAWSYTFVGRSSGGRRVRLALFAAVTLGTDYRVLEADSTSLADTLAVLRTNSVGLVSIEDQSIVWKSYVDCNANDHWIKVLRA